MKSYCEKARLFMSWIKDLKIQAIRRELNSQADALVKGTAYREFSEKKNLSVKEDLAKKEEKKLREVNMFDVLEESEEECYWMKEIVDF